MAENKKKVVVYTDWLKNFEDLTDEELGKLMRHFFQYVNDLNPILEDRLLKIAWKPIENTLKRDLQKWETYVDKQRENGQKGGRPKKTQKTQAFKNKPKKAVSDSVSVSVNDNESESEININNNAFLKNCLKSQMWLEQVAMKGYKLELVKTKLAEFENHLFLTSDQKQSIKEFQSHFLNWLARQKEKATKSNESPTSKIIV